MKLIGYYEISSTVLQYLDWRPHPGPTGGPGRLVADSSLRNLRQYIPEREFSYVRYSRLLPGGWTPWHRDPKGWRVHIVIETNPLAFLYVESQIQPCAVGEVWTFDASLPHCAANWGTTDRTHLYLAVKGAKQPEWRTP